MTIDVGELGDTHATQGWVRRLTPPDWLDNVHGESAEAAAKASWLTVLGALLRVGSVRWLSKIDHIAAAENKLVMEAAAKKLELQTPRTIVTNDKTMAQDLLGSRVLAKPLGPGHYVSQDRAFNVFARVLDLNHVSPATIAAVPFLLQESLAAQAHYRVVTVRDQVWGGVLAAGDLPVDWRQSPAAHAGFDATVLPSELVVGATSLANELNLGYSSQDWVRTANGYFVLDVNPSGQWMFLPGTLSQKIAQAIAGWISG